MLLSTKDLVWKIRNKEIKKLIKRFVKLYKIKNYIREHDIVEVTSIDEDLPSSIYE